VAAVRGALPVAVAFVIVAIAASALAARTDAVSVSASKATMGTLLEIAFC
jgi:hypothetical protein